MKGLKLEKNSYGLRVYCTTCERNYNQATLQKCTHPNSQGYKSIVYVGGGTKVKHHNTRDLGEALTLAINFKKEVKRGMLDVFAERGRVLPQQITVLGSAEAYLEYKNGIGVYDFEKRNYDKSYLSSIKLYLQQFMDSLRNHGFNVEVMPLSALRKEHLQYWWKDLTNRYSAPRTRDYAKRALRAWINHAINKQEVDIRNPFLDVKIHLPEVEVTTISEQEFLKVCEAVNTADKYAYLGGKTTVRKNRFRDYLIDAFWLGLYTGLRREELVSLKWKDVYYEKNSGKYLIKVTNLKAERIMDKKYKPKVLPVHDQLHKLLVSLGWDNFKASDAFILEPYRTFTEQTMMDAISKGFSHYYSKAFPNSKLKHFKCLRKTYLSYLTKEVGDNVIQLSSHSDTDVLEKHYINPEIVIKGHGMKVF